MTEFSAQFSCNYTGNGTSYSRNVKDHRNDRGRPLLKLPFAGLPHCFVWLSGNVATAVDQDENRKEDAERGEKQDQNPVAERSAPLAAGRRGALVTHGAALRGGGGCQRADRCEQSEKNNRWPHPGAPRVARRGSGGGREFRRRRETNRMRTRCESRSSISLKCSAFDHRVCT
jgi:hypothetical protein